MQLKAIPPSPGGSCRRRQYFDYLVAVGTDQAADGQHGGIDEPKWCGTYEEPLKNGEHHGKCLVALPHP
ncbi:MAG TPA: hypothetical protein VK502_02420 [Candidatus Saccharimonadales bacterium]|nr:hypothetical protein [Candidatus Saccharimonadales bacterium]